MLESLVGRAAKPLLAIISTDTDQMKMRRGDKARRRVGSEMNRAKSLPLLPLPLPPPPPPEMTKTAVRPRRAGAVLVKSVTRDEIDRYWRMKRMDEEEHLLAALKAAARIRARALTVSIITSTLISCTLVKIISNSRHKRTSGE